MFAGAASYSDQADIKASTAVDMLSSLGVIQGYDDGSFKPNTTVTRAQMAKMIFTIMNGGNDNANAYASLPTAFTDLPTAAWAQGYVRYLQNTGIIAGKSATKFAPNDTVTGLEAAKMVLVAAGYNAQKAGLTGAAWAQNTMKYGQLNNLFEDVDTDLNAALPRQYAAQILYNALDMERVVWSNDIEDFKPATDVDDDKTIGGKYMDLVKTDAAQLLSVEKTSGKKTYEIELATAVKYGDGTHTKTKFDKVPTDVADLIGLNVKILVKAKSNGNTDVYGVYADDDSKVIATGTVGTLDTVKNESKKFKVDGTEYKAEKALADVPVIYPNEETPNAAIDTLGEVISTKNTYPADSIKAIDLDGNNKADRIVVVPTDVKEVTYVGSSAATIGGKSYKFDDVAIYDGVKKDDYVVLTASGNYANKEGRIEKATVVSGKVTGTKGTPVNKVTVDGTVYEMAGKGDTMVKAPSLNSKVDMVVINGYVYYVDTQSGSVDDVALLVEAGKANGIGNKWEARLIFADGSDKTVTVEKYWEDKDNKDHAIGTIAEAAGGILVTYEKSGDTYTLTKVGEDKTYEQDAKDPEFAAAGYDAYITNTSGKTDGSIKGGTFVAKDDNGETIANVSRLYYDANATVFVKYDGTEDASYKVVTGKTASGYDKTITGAAALADKSGNSYYGKAVFLNMSNQKSTGGSSDKTYAVALSSQTKDSSSGSTMYTVKGWNGSEEITFKSEDSFSIKAGEIFEYSAAGNDLYDIDPVDTDTM